MALAAPTSALRPTKRVYVITGSYDPPHNGHWRFVRELETRIDEGKIHDGEVWLVPVFLHPWKQLEASFEDRVQMCTLLCEDASRAKVSRVAKQIGGTSHMYRLLQGLQMFYPETSFVAAVGSDLWQQRKQEFGWQQLKREFPFYRSTQDRRPDISSTAVRGDLSHGVVPLNLNNLISNYVVTNQLYGLASAIEAW